VSKKVFAKIIFQTCSTFSVLLLPESNFFQKSNNIELMISIDRKSSIQFFPVTLSIVSSNRTSFHDSEKKLFLIFLYAAFH